MTMTDNTLDTSTNNSTVEEADGEQIEDVEEEETAEPNGTAAAAPVAVEPAPIVMPSPDPITVTGLFAGLSLLSGANESPMILAIAKMQNGELRVSVQPPVKKDEPNGSALPLIVCGTPEELDLHFLAALGTYVPARNYAVASVDAVAQSIKNAADAARTKTAKKTTTGNGTAITQEKTKQSGTATAAAAAPVPPAPVVKKGFGLLTVVTTPAGAAIRVVDSKGKTHTPESGHELTCAEGRATVTITAQNFNTKLQAVTIGPSPQTLTIDLVALPGLFADPPPLAANEAADAGAAAPTDSVVNETPSVAGTADGVAAPEACTCTAEFADPRCATHQPQLV